MAALSPNALQVLETRYLLRDAQRRIVETPDQLFSRVARAVASVEPSRSDEWERRFHALLSSLDFLPNSPTLMNAGTSMGQLSACFVLPVGDTMEEIFEALKRMALVQRTGGGTGFSFSSLRPRGDVVSSTAGEASGPVSFMKIFDCATENIKQGGKRRGANMGVLRVDHPDILEFIAAKEDDVSLQNFNLSVGVTDAFMEAAERDRSYALIHPRTGAATGSLRAAEVFEKIARAAWKTGDPGLLFLDAVNRSNPTLHLGRIEATNPCGEIPLHPYESCNLGSINLRRMLSDGKIDGARLADTVRVAVRFLDDVIEANRYPFPEIESVTQGNRRIGLGVMGFAEMLIDMGIPYDSDPAAAAAEAVMGAIAREALAASERLAEERGVYPNWKTGPRVRHATRTAIAPTGTISIIAGTSASIEPLFALAYRRKNVLGGKTLVEINPVLSRRLGSGAADLEIPEPMRPLFVTALQIPPRRHLEIQAAFQRHVDNSVSKTINLPAESTWQEIADAYRLAWKMNLKGITVYRYGSKSTQVLELGLDEPAYVHEHSQKCDPGECRV